MNEEREKSYGDYSDEVEDKDNAASEKYESKRKDSESICEFCGNPESECECSEDDWRK